MKCLEKKFVRIKYQLPAFYREEILLEVRDDVKERVLGIVRGPVKVPISRVIAPIETGLGTND